jgi:Tfp pilus assembly protein FimT
VELILVVVIVGGLAALAWPRLARLSQTLAVRAAAGDLVGMMARARLEALSRREPVEVRFGAASVAVVRPQVRYAKSETSSQSASLLSASGVTGAWEEESGEVTVLAYSLPKAVAWSRLQVLPARRELITQEEDGGWGQTTSTATSQEEVVTVTFYPDGTSDDALIGVGEPQAAATYVVSQASGASRSGGTPTGEVGTQYVVRVRGLVGRATLSRSVDESDEEYFAAVPDVLPASTN